MSMHQPQFNTGFYRDEHSSAQPSWDRDFLGRKNAAHQLERLIANSTGPYVIAMTADWGCGKTFFLKAWEKDLSERVRPCVYFNAWESDHAGDPLLALTGCIAETLRQKGYLDSPQPTKLEALASSIAKKSPTLLAKCLVGWGNHLTHGALNDIKDDLINSLEFGTQLFLENEKRRKDFSRQLEDIAKEVASKPTGINDNVNKAQRFPLFVMIDELDRCRPDYAIELLESVKHLFNVPGVVFLLAIDGEQMLNVIEHRFGLKEESEKTDKRKDYLKKFVDIFWQLPIPNDFDFLFSLLATKKIPLPKRWKTVSRDYWKGQLGEKQEYYLSDENSFYTMLACVTLRYKKNLRDYVQSVELFNILSTAYELSPEEAFLIFNTLIKESNKIRDISLDISMSKNSTSENPTEHIIAVHNTDYCRAVYDAFYDYIYNQNNTIIGDAHKYLPHMLLTSFVKNIMGGFETMGLRMSATKKMKFLEYFHLEIPEIFDKTNLQS